MGLLQQLLGLEGGGLFNSSTGIFGDKGVFGKNRLPAGHVVGSTPAPERGDGSASYAQLARGETGQKFYGHADRMSSKPGYKTRHMLYGGRAHGGSGGSHYDRVTAQARQDAKAEAAKTTKKGKK